MFENIINALVGVSVSVAQPGIGDNYLHLINLKTKSVGYYKLVSSDQNAKIVHYLESFPMPRTIADTSNVRSLVNTHRIDCKKQTLVITKVELYSDTAALTVPIRTSNAASETMKVNLNRDVVGTRLYKAACLNQTSESEPSESMAQGENSVSQRSDSQENPDSVKVKGGAINGVADATPVGRDGKPIFQPDKPVEISPMSEEKPFADSKITLGTLGLLSEYVYYESEQLAFKAAVLEKFNRGYEASVPDRGPMKVTLDTAKQRLEKEFDAYQERISQKEALLKRMGLTQLSLPQRDHEPWGSFYAELYQEKLSGELILVFRGTNAPLDWVNNIWLGLDLFKIEAPHYSSARELLQALVKAGKKPIVTGHSLGGGLAQYTAAKFGLRAVAFNSSPLPVRYFSSTKEVNPAKIRVYSALEKTPNSNDDAYRPDPVSIAVPNALERTNAALSNEYFKAHFHLVKPICVESAPEPFTTPAEEEEIQDQINGAMLTGILSAIKGGKATAIADKGLELKIKNGIRESVDHPAWRPSSNTPYAMKVSETVVAEVQKSAVLVYQELGGSVKTIKGMGELLMGKYVDGAKTWGGVVSNIALKSALRNHLHMPHSMSRFNRGMHVQLEANPFLAESVMVQCAKPGSLY